MFLSYRYKQNNDSPAAVPQQMGIHQADEKSVSSTSSGNNVTFLWIWSKFSTKARTTPTINNTSPRRIKLADWRLCTEPHAWRSTEVMMDIISPVLQTIQPALDSSCVFTLGEQEQLQQRSSSIGIWHCEKRTRNY